MDALLHILDPDTRWDFLDLGPGSANKSGAFLALLLVASLWFGLAFRRGWVVTGVLAIPLLFGLFATGSRGGLLAAVAGIVATFWAAGCLRPTRLRDLPRKALAWLGAGTALVAVAFFAWGPGTRFVAMATGKDASTALRAEMYGAGLRMLADAPGGWGAGRASAVFRHWYQEPDGSRHFLSLVNSHLTWMTERGLGFRAAYLAGWGLVLGLLWPGRGGHGGAARGFGFGLRSAGGVRRRGSGDELRGAASPQEPGAEATRPRGMAEMVAFGLWVCLGVGACFSSTLTWPGDGGSDRRSGKRV